MKVLNTIAFILVVIGAINWGLVGVADLNVVELVLGSVSWLMNLVYILVGLSGIMLVFTHRKACKECGPVAQATV